MHCFTSNSSRRFSLSKRESTTSPNYSTVKVCEVVSLISDDDSNITEEFNDGLKTEVTRDLTLEDVEVNDYIFRFFTEQDLD